MSALWSVVRVRRVRIAHWSIAATAWTWPDAAEARDFELRDVREQHERRADADWAARYSSRGPGVHYEVLPFDQAETPTCPMGTW
jgi:hypothetical protein